MCFTATPKNEQFIAGNRRRSHQIFCGQYFCNPQDKMRKSGKSIGKVESYQPMTISKVSVISYKGKSNVSCSNYVFSINPSSNYHLSN